MHGLWYAVLAVARHVGRAVRGSLSQYILDVWRCRKSFYLQILINPSVYTRNTLSLVNMAPATVAEKQLTV